MSHRPLTKRRTVSVLTAMAFALSLLFAAPTPALALDSTLPSAAAAAVSKPLTTYDKIPATGRSWYYSAGNGNGTFVPAARVRQQGRENGWGIRWVKGKGMTVRVAISDLVADGKRPIFVISYDYGNGRNHTSRELTTNGSEPTYTVPRSTTIKWKKGVTDWRKQSVLFTVCNGRDDSGEPTDCGHNHGPFHAY